jgi:hypothetical protein
MPRGDLADLGYPSAVRLPRPTFGHLRDLTEQRGLWEHARYSTPRPEHGFCNDDNARALVVVAREQTEDLTDLAAIYLGFVLSARRPDGRFHNRRDLSGSWVDDTGSDDSEGRAWWGLGAIARQGPEAWMKESALEDFESCSTFQSVHLRSNAYAALGAAEVVTGQSPVKPAVELLDRTSGLIAKAARATIGWPESRLTYDNARIPEALIAAGIALGDARRTSLGIRLLDWLALNESQGNRFSFTPVGGREPGVHEPRFDQQPIEAWAMADACYRAWSVTGESRWAIRALRAACWLLGNNDKDALLYDAESGGTFDGLTPDGVNLNQGAESTLAGIGILQVAAKCWRDLELTREECATRPESFWRRSPPAWPSCPASFA